MILITGAYGQLGREFQQFFDRLGLEYIAVGHKELDITNEGDVKKILKNKDIDYIINCAAYNDVDRAEEEDEKCFDLNSAAVKRLAVAAKGIGAVYVTYSTDFVFDGEKGSPYTEEDVPNPLGVYSRSKFEGEKGVMEACERSFVIRTSWVYGHGNENFVKKVIEWSKVKNEIKVVDDQVSAPTYSKDLAEYSWNLINSGKFGLYHLTNSGEASKYKQAKYILETLGWKGSLIRGKTGEFNLPAKRPGYSKLSSEKAEKILGRKMPCWKDGINRFLKEMGYLSE